MFLIHQWKTFYCLSKSFLSVMSFCASSSLYRNYIAYYVSFYQFHLLCLKMYFWNVTYSWFLYLSIILFMKDAWFSRACCHFVGACLWISSPISSSTIKLKIVVLRSHLNNTIFKIKYTRLIRKVFIISICLVFCGILSIPVTSFSENMITRFLLSQNIESFLVCLLLLDQCKNWRILKPCVTSNYVFTTIDFTETFNYWFCRLQTKIIKENEVAILWGITVQAVLPMSFRQLEIKFLFGS